MLTDRGQPCFATARAHWPLVESIQAVRAVVATHTHTHSKKMSHARHTQLHRQDTDTTRLRSLTSGLHPPNRQEGSLGRDAEQFPVHMRLEGQLLMPSAPCARSTSTSRPSCPAVRWGKALVVKRLQLCSIFVRHKTRLELVCTVSTNTTKLASDPNKPNSLTSAR
jgi:hypothetical protein